MQLCSSLCTIYKASTTCTTPCNKHVPLSDILASGIELQNPDFPTRSLFHAVLLHTTWYLRTLQKVRWKGRAHGQSVMLVMPFTAIGIFECGAVITPQVGSIRAAQLTKRLPYRRGRMLYHRRPTLPHELLVYQSQNDIGTFINGRLQITSASVHIPLVLFDSTT